jgi:hypothetical protein
VVFGSAVRIIAGLRPKPQRNETAAGHVSKSATTPSAPPSAVPPAGFVQHLEPRPRPLNPRLARGLPGSRPIGRPRVQPGGGDFRLGRRVPAQAIVGPVPLRYPSGLPRRRFVGANAPSPAPPLPTRSARRPTFGHDDWHTGLQSSKSRTGANSPAKYRPCGRLISASIIASIASAARPAGLGSWELALGARSGTGSPTRCSTSWRPRNANKSEAPPRPRPKWLKSSSNPPRPSKPTMCPTAYRG